MIHAINNCAYFLFNILILPDQFKQLLILLFFSMPELLFVLMVGL